MKTTRKLASIKKITYIKPIPEADSIECAIVDGGWPVVIQKGEYKVGDVAIYLEIDSWVPHELAPFLSKGKEPREYNGVKGERLKTVKLRGQISQGLLLGVDVLAEVDYTIGDDVSKYLNIQKWEEPIPPQLQGMMKGNFPNFIPKTDQERCISEGTLIQTDEGIIPIEEIVNSKLQVNVLSYNHNTNLMEFKPIIHWSSMTRKDNWVKITLKSGKEIVCTKDHKIWCDDIQSYMNAEDIEIGQKFITKTEL